MPSKKGTDGKFSCKLRPITDVGDGTSIITLSCGLTSVIDTRDRNLIEKSHWSINTHGYAQGCLNGKVVKLHRVIAHAAKGQHVDHISGDILDNRQSNLRLCTHAQNMCNKRLTVKNTSGFKGVTFCKSSGKWKAQIQSGGKGLGLGRFDSPEEAHKAYCFAASRLHEEFASDGQSQLRHIPDVGQFEFERSERRHSNNKSGFRGVSFHNQSGKWRATIYINRKQKHLGLFDSPEEAHAVYVAAARSIPGMSGSIFERAA